MFLKVLHPIRKKRDNKFRRQLPCDHMRNYLKKCLHIFLAPISDLFDVIMCLKLLMQNYVN